MLSNKKVKKDNTEEEKKIAEKLNEAISKAEEEKADVTAQRFAEITGDANLCAIRQLVRRFETEGGRTVVSMLQAVFLSHGMKHAAEELDILSQCEKFDHGVYETFTDELMDMTNNRNNEITYDIMEHIAVLGEVGGRDEKWTKEINVVAWNGGKPKIDVRDWDENHERMSRGITLTEDQAMMMTKALVDRYRTRASQDHSTPMREDYTR